MLALRSVLTTTLLCLPLCLAVGCKKKDEAGDAAADGADGADKAGADKAGADKADEADAEKAAPEVPTEVEVPAGTDGAAAGGSAGGGGGAGAGGAPAAPREDLTCDPLEKGACLEGETCIGAQGCDETWSCDATIVCKKGVREYCGCDGRTFEAVYGNCPWQKYQYPGPCK